ncbi:MAG: V-type ATP synthase subunit E [Candidatus Latescibacterota bacterium]
MSFEKIQTVIISEAELEAKRILEEARGETDAMLSRAREENERTFEEAARQAEAAASRETSRQVGLARHEGRLQALDAKNRVIDEVFRKAAGRIQALPEQEYLALMADWLKALPSGVGGILRVSSRDVNRFSGAFLEGINKERSQSGKFTGVEADSQIAGGFVVIGENYTMNATIENKINDLRESLAGDLAKELFGT